MLFQLKEKNKLLEKNNNSFKKIRNIILKIKSIAKNTIYLKTSLNSDDMVASPKDLAGKPKFNIDKWEYQHHNGKHH